MDLLVLGIRQVPQIAQVRGRGHGEGMHAGMYSRHSGTRRLRAGHASAKLRAPLGLRPTLVAKRGQRAQNRAHPGFANVASATCCLFHSHPSSILSAALVAVDFHACSILSHDTTG
jgi:hypothetical protein